MPSTPTPSPATRHRRDRPRVGQGAQGHRAHALAGGPIRGACPPLTPTTAAATLVRHGHARHQRPQYELVNELQVGSAGGGRLVQAGGGRPEGVDAGERAGEERKEKK